MFFLNPLFALLTLALALALGVYISATVPSGRWPSISQAVAFLTARSCLLTLDASF